MPGGSNLKRKKQKKIEFLAYRLNNAYNIIYSKKLPVKRWNAIKPHVINNGLTKRKSCDLVFKCDKIICIDFTVKKFSIVTLGNVLAFNLRERICERMVSISISTSRYGPRNHCNDLIMTRMRRKKIKKNHFSLIYKFLNAPGNYSPHVYQKCFIINSMFHTDKLRHHDQ